MAPSPLADLLPNRRRLLELYDTGTVINSPHFLRTRPWTLDNLIAKCTSILS
ncbi:hypothetical protein BDZ97DRAFT_1652604 [Flammula alnicola]|nr:hypothetical protein BDZ97DRAFT_1652604 [Flammula alnicola]